MLEFNTIIIHFGEIGLKGKNRSSFVGQLRENIELKLKHLTFNNSQLTNKGQKSHVKGQMLNVGRAHGYLYIDELEEREEKEVEEVMTLLREVTGIVWYAEAKQLKQVVSSKKQEEMSDLIEEEVIKLANNVYQPDKTFAVKARRADKSFELTSHELEVRLGKLIQDQTKWQEVNLDEPDQTFYMDVYPSAQINADQNADQRRHDIFIYPGKHRGLGGLPVGSSGRVLSLLSGGIDSPVSSYLMAKRGCGVDFIHFTATKLQHKEAQQYKVSQLVCKLSRFTLRSKLYLVPYIPFQLAIMDKNLDHELIIFRRFMVRVAERLANETRIQALVTGDNLGQVASQTLPNLVSTSQAIALPTLRPLLGHDKVEIIELAKQIDTYELSLEPYKDCCSIVSRQPRTRSESGKLEKIEQQLFSDYEKLIDDTLAEVVSLEYEDGELT